MKRRVASHWAVRFNLQVWMPARLAIIHRLSWFVGVPKFLRSVSISHSVLSVKTGSLIFPFNTLPPLTSSQTQVNLCTQTLKWLGATSDLHGTHLGNKAVMGEIHISLNPPNIWCWLKAQAKNRAYWPDVWLFIWYIMWLVDAIPFDFPIG